MARVMRRKREKKRLASPPYFGFLPSGQGNSVLVSGIAPTHDAEPTTLSRITWPLALSHCDKRIVRGTC